MTASDLTVAVLVAAALVAAAPFARCLAAPATFVTFPFLVAMVWLGHIVRELFALVLYPGPVHPGVIEAGLLDLSVMVLLCLLAGQSGWSCGMSVADPAARPRTPASPSRPHPDKGDHLVLAGLVIGVAAFVFFVALVRMVGGFARYFSADGAAALDWVGTEVVLVVMGRLLLYPALVVNAYAFFRHRRPLSLLATAVIALWPLLAIVFAGRRSEVLLLALSLGAAAFFASGWRPPRWLVAAAPFAMIAVILLFPAYRAYAPLGADRARVLDIDAGELLAENFLKKSGRDVENALLYVATANRNGFWLGSLLFNELLKKSVPGTLIGPELKRRLAFDVPGVADLSYRTFAGARPYWYRHVNIAGRLYADFWYFGALFLWFAGYGFARLFRRALGGSEAAILTYACLILYVPHFIAKGYGHGLIQIASVAGIVLVITRLAPGTGQGRTGRTPAADGFAADRASGRAGPSHAGSNAR